MPIQFRGHEWFVSRLYDMQEACSRQGQPVMTSFLTPAEQEIARQILSSQPIRFEGGFPEAERKQLILLPWELAGLSDNMNEESDTNGRQDEISVSLQQMAGGDVICLYSQVNSNLELPRHPDVLGTLLHEGISRDVLGDILCSEQGIFLFVRKSMADYIIQNIRRIKKQSVLFTPCTKENVPAQPRIKMKINVASLRADNVVAALAHCSRSRALEMIRQGFVKINDVVLEDQKKLCNNDHVSIRRCGRFRFIEVEAVTRKDRMVLIFEKYS